MITPPPTDEPNASDHGAIFEWAPEKHSPWRLVPPLLLSGLVLLGLSILFDVSDPVGTRPPTMNRQLIHLDPSDPGAAMALSRARDQSALILSSTGEPTPFDRTLLPTFQPSFLGFSLQLKELTANRLEIPPARLFHPSDIALKPLAARPPPESVPPAPNSFVLHPVFENSLAAEPIRLPPDLTGIRPSDTQRLRFHLEVHPSGDILTALPLSSGEEADLLNALHDRLAGMRFAPTPSTTIRRGSVRFEWQPSGSPSSP